MLFCKTKLHFLVAEIDVRSKINLDEAGSNCADDPFCADRDIRRALVPVPEWEVKFRVEN